MLGLAGLLVLLGLQAAFAPLVAIDGIPPDLPLVVVLVLAMFLGPGRGGAAGLAAGFGMDLLRGSRIGLFALAAGTAGWLCGEAASRIDPGRASVRWVLASASSLVYGLVVAACTVLLDRNGVHATGAVRHVLVACVYDGTLAAFGYGLVELVRALLPNPLLLRPSAAHWRTPLPPPVPRGRPGGALGRSRTRGRR